MKKITMRAFLSSVALAAALATMPGAQAAWAAPTDLAITGANGGGGGGGGGYGEDNGGAGGAGGGLANGGATATQDGGDGGAGAVGSTSITNSGQLTGGANLSETTTGGDGGAGGVYGTTTPPPAPGTVGPPDGATNGGNATNTLTGEVKGDTTSLTITGGAGGKGGDGGKGGTSTTAGTDNYSDGADGADGGSGQSIALESKVDATMTTITLKGGAAGADGNPGAAGVGDSGPGSASAGGSGGHGGNVSYTITDGAKITATDILLSGYHSSTNGGTVTFTIGDGTNGSVVIADSLKFAEHFGGAKDGHGDVFVKANSTLRVKDVDLYSQTGAGINYSTFQIDTTGQTIFGDDLSSWDQTGGGSPHYGIGATDWINHELKVAGKVLAKYQGGRLAYLGQLDSVTHKAVSLNLSRVTLGVGTTAVAPGGSGAFGNSSLTVINSPYYIFNNTYYGDLYQDPLDVQAAIKVNSGANGNPFQAGGPGASLMLVVDNNTKAGDQLIALQNVDGSGATQNFGSLTDQGWFKSGNAFSTSRLLDVIMSQDASKILATFSAADATKTLPGISRSTASLLKTMITEVGHNVGASEVNGHHVSSGVHFVSRAADFLYMPDGVEGAKTIESAMQLGTIGGMQETTSTINVVSSDTVHTRVQQLGSLLAPAAGDTVTGFGLWATPVYQSTKIDGIEAGSFDLDYDADFFGAVVGGDYTFDSNVRLGLAFDVGSGSTESDGRYSRVKNDFDYWGLSLYSGWSNGPLTISGDVSYTKNEGDLRQRLPETMLLDDLTADVDTSIWGVGAKAEYLIRAKAVDLTPYLGLRYMNIRTNGYDVMVNPNYSPGADGHVFHVDTENQNVWRVPLGVKLSKDIQAENGLVVTPSLGLGAIFTMGDRDTTSNTRIPGVSASATNTVGLMDRSTFDGRTGLSFRKENVSFNLDYNLQASEHRTGHTGSATLRVDF